MEILEIKEGTRELYTELLKDAPPDSLNWSERALTAAAWDRGQPIGIAAIDSEDDTYYIYNLYVLPQYRFTGVGSSLLEVLISQCAMQDIEAVHFREERLIPKEAGAINDLSVQMEGLKRFFEKSGFMVYEKIENLEDREILVLAGIKILVEETEWSSIYSE